MKICAATGNAGKLRELRRILEAQGHEVVSQKELGITIEPDETGTTFEANALIKAGKDFDLVVIPGARHTMGEDFGEHKRYDFFVRHLLGVTPPSWDQVRTK